MTQLRDPGLNERRCILRHQLGFYHGLVVAGIYSFPTEEFPELTNRSFLIQYFSKALEYCVDHHPILASVVSGADTDTPKFHLAANLNISNHISIWSADTIPDRAEPAQDRAISDKIQLVEKIMERLTNEPFADVSAVPPWRMAVVDTLDWSNDTDVKLLVAYYYSHSHADGTSGLTFHRTLLQALLSMTKLDASAPLQMDDGVFWTSSSNNGISLPPALDAPIPLPISWSYLLRTITTEFLPQPPRLAFWWSSPKPSKPWTGSRIFYNKDLFRTAVQLVSVEPQAFAALLQKCRSKNVKLTGLLDSLLAHSLSAAIGNSSNSTVLKGAIPINLQKAINVPSDQMGVMSSVWMQTHDSAATDSENLVKRARNTTDALAKAANTLQDQPVGLLRLIGNFRSWYEGKLGKARGESYEVSNIMAFDPAAFATRGAAGLQNRTVTIEELFYTQGANVTGPAITFNVVSVKGGALNVGVSWQVGALGLETDREDDQTFDEAVERELVKRLRVIFEEAVDRFIDAD